MDTVIKDFFDYTVEIYSMEDESLKLIENNLKKLLDSINKSEFYGKFYYILRELTENAERANAKRSYSIENNLGIAELSDPAKLKKFVEFYRESSEELIIILKKNNFVIRIELKVRNNNIIIRITNNSEISPLEKSRIEKRIEKSFEINNMREAVKFLRDKSESGGLGIISIILALKNIGGTNDSIEYFTHLPGHTIVQISLPVYVITDENILKIADEVYKTIDAIPKMPENLIALQKELGNPDVEISAISRLIKKDPGLTVEILKTVNSGLYMLPNKITSIKQAITLLGLSGLKSIVYTTGTRKVFKSQKDINSIWQHSYMCANFAQAIGKIFNMNDIIDELILCGFLHDIGKIILLGDEGIKKIEKHLKNSNMDISNTKIEEIFFVLNHALVGSKIVDKWNLPANIISAIQYHHDPEEINSEDKPYVYTTYLANLLIGVDNNRYTLPEVNIKVMRFFNCNNFNELEELQQKVKDMVNTDLSAV